MVAKTYYGLEVILAEELERLGAKNIRPLNRAVGFTGDKQLLYKANYCLRTALKILVPLTTAFITDESALYNFIRKVQWENYFTVRSTFAVEAVVKSTVFRHSHYVEQKVKDAVADRFREHFSIRPSVDTKDPDVRIHINIMDNSARLSLDSSGDALFKRGYRVGRGPAPLNEVLAAGIIKKTGWEGKLPLIDFMCGSGTIVIEAAMAALGLPPGVVGRKYGFQQWKDYDPKLFNDITSPFNRRGGGDKFRIYASDISSRAVNTARINAKRAGIEDNIEFTIGSFEQSIPICDKMLILVNPPYGERLKQDNINDLYARLGNKLKRDFTGSEAWIFSGNKEALKYIGLHPAQRSTLFNGQLECKLQQYILYKGSKKIRTSESQ